MGSVITWLAVSLLVAQAVQRPAVQGPVPAAEPPVAAALRHVPPAAATARFENDLPAIERVYARRAYEPLWTTIAGLTSRGQRVLDEIRRAREQGLEPRDYLLDAIDRQLSASFPDAAPALDVLVSLAVTRYAHDLGWGITLPSEVDRANAYETREFTPDDVLSRVTEAPDPALALRSYEPPTFVYRDLKQALAELRAVAAAGGWQPVTAGPVLREGDRGPRVEELRQRLAERGDLPANEREGDTYDAALTAAVRRFQDRHGLTVDGICGPAVVAELNVPVSTRIQQVRLAMERIRWLPLPTSGRRVVVNLADFRAYLLDGDGITLESRAIIGKRYSATPMFTATMTYVVINPYWNVPVSIYRAEILPHVRRDPDYLRRNHMEPAGNTVRQLPGPWNALGRYKFMFPNPHNVYMHDTPARTLFERADRAFSHGCIRLERPAEFAALLLGPQGWTPEQLQRTVEAGRQVVVPLATPVPVTISYATAFRKPDGVLHFRRDVYGRDRKLLDALARRSQGDWGE
jgi:murein L,D-transpeptidase YcbB/YkuD